MSHIQISDYFDILDRSRKVYYRLLEPVCTETGLTRNEVDVLLFLWNNPAFDRASDIVSRRGMAKSHVSQSVSNLADRGLVERVWSPTDRRTVHLKLTAAGKAVTEQAREAQEAFFSLLHRDIPPEEMDTFRIVTGKIWENIRNL